MSPANEAQAAGAAPAAAESTDLLGQILEATKPPSERDRAQTQDFIAEVVRQAMHAQGDKVLSRDVEHTIKLWIGELDKQLTNQLNAVMHHPDFQKLEGTWRGLDYLVKQTETSTSLKLKVLNVSKQVLKKDLERAAEFDQSTLFKKVYEAEYGTLGGEPFGLLMGDYEFGKHPDEDFGLLKMIAGVAASAHAPFVAGAAPALLSLESYTELNAPRDLAKIFEGVEYTAWKSFRESEDSRYVSLVLPRVLARLPYGPDFKRVEEFNFQESVDGTDHSKYLWMNAAWAYAARVTDAFAKDGWFMRTRGVEGGGKVEGLPVHTFTAAGGTVMKCPTEVVIPDRRENELSELGFMPLLHCKNTDFAAFLGAQSCQKPKKYFDAGANANAELSTKFNYLLCVSRFAHYLKVMARDRIGSFMESDECERWLNEWISNYVISNPQDAGPETKAKCPLREASVKVTSVAGKPGWYQAVAHLRPHFQLEGIDASMRLVAEVPKRKG